MRGQFDILYVQVGIISLDVIEVEHRIVIVSEADQTTHADIFSVENDLEIYTDADRGLLQRYGRIDIADYDRPAAFDIEFLGAEVVEFVNSLLVKVLCRNEKL